MNKTTEKERERKRDEERESPVTTNYNVKNLSFPRKQASQQFNGLLNFKTKEKKKRQTEIKSLIETSNYLNNLYFFFVRTINVEE